MIFQNDLPKIDGFLIYDRNLESRYRSWIHRFKLRYAVTAGEELKDIENFASHVKRILAICKDADTRHMQFVVFGGGSVGDFGGFLASIFKRGVRLIHIPSTWLAAIDSAHGGKTALNVASAKNQLGTFYPASETYIVARVLAQLPQARLVEAYGELAKMALLCRIKLPLKSDLEHLMLRSLRPAISAKLKVVKKDPYEKNGHRQILNLGHTWGHILEAALGIPHGVAVYLGLWFCIEWSFGKKLLGRKDYLESRKILERIPRPGVAKISEKTARSLLVKDKKRDGKKITYIFLKAIGRPVRLSVGVESLLAEATRQGWLRK